MKRFMVSKKLTGLFAGLLLFALSSSVQAGLIQWEYDATISLRAGATDSLGIAGETLSMLLTFDDTDVWQQIGPWLFYPTHAATASITNHTAALNTASPAALAGGGFTEAVGSNSWVDLIIDGQLTQMLNFSGPISVGPAAGDHLLPSHLPTTGFGESYSDVFRAAIDYGIDGIADYYFVNSSATVSAVPEPATLLLLGSGLVGLVGFRRKFRK